jgi:hypothetical protein
VTTDLPAFLRARLDEDEAGARLALGWAPTPWTLQAHDPRFPGDADAYEWANLNAGDGDVLVGGDSSLPTDVARHIARHDPARVLAEVDAKRRIVDAYRAAFVRKATTWRNYARWANGKPDRRYPVLGRLPKHGEEADIPGLYLALRLLALPYSDHPDYRQEWAP